MLTKDLRPKSLTEKLKKIRVDLDLSQNELIERLGIKNIVFKVIFQSMNSADVNRPYMSFFVTPELLKFMSIY